MKASAVVLSADVAVTKAVECVHVPTSGDVRAALEAAEPGFVTFEIRLDACRGTAIVVTTVEAYMAASSDVSAALRAADFSAELSGVSSERSVDACNACRGTAIDVTTVEIH